MFLNNISKTGSILALVVMLTTFSALKFYQYRISNVQLVDIPIENLPMHIGEWRATESEGLGLRSLEILKLKRYVRRYYRRPDGAEIYLYIGYWDKQSGDYQAAKHSPKACLPANGWSITNQNSDPQEIKDAAGNKILTCNKVIGEMKGRSTLFKYWFFSGEKSYWKEWQALINISLENFFRGRTDGGIIEISTELGRTELGSKKAFEGSKLIDEFILDFHPELVKLISNPIPQN